MNKGIFHGLLIATPLAALVLYFAFTGKEEVKQEQRLQQAVHKLDGQKFDDDFADAWNQQPPGVIEKRKGKVKELEADVANATARRDGLDLEADQLHGAMNQAIKDEDARLTSAPASAVKSAPIK